MITFRSKLAVVGLAMALGAAGALAGPAHDVPIRGPREFDDWPRRTDKGRRSRREQPRQRWQDEQWTSPERRAAARSAVVKAQKRKSRRAKARP